MNLTTTPELDEIFNISSSSKDVSKGSTTRIRGISRFIVKSFPLGTIFKARDIAIKVQSVIGDLDLNYFYEQYDSRPQHTKGETQVEYEMKDLELKGIVKRVGVRTWERIAGK